MGVRYKLLNFKASEEEIAAWDAHANKTSHRNRSRWIRDTLNAALTGQTFVPFPIESAVELRPAPAIEVAKELRARASQKKGKCEKRLPTGTFCKSCGDIH